MVATELIKLAMEMDEERKARLKKMVATTQLRLALETVTKEELDWNICQITQSIYLTTYNCSILRGASLIKLTRTIHFFRTIHVIARAGVIFGIYFTSCRYSGG